MNKVRIELSFAVIVEGNFKEWTENGKLSIADAVEEWIQNSDPPALRLECDKGEGFKLYHDDFESGVIFADDIHCIEDLTHELEEV